MTLPGPPPVSWRGSSSRGVSRTLFRAMTWKRVPTSCPMHRQAAPPKFWRSSMDHRRCQTHLKMAWRNPPTNRGLNRGGSCLARTSAICGHIGSRQASTTPSSDIVRTGKSSCAEVASNPFSKSRWMPPGTRVQRILAAAATDVLITLCSTSVPFRRPRLKHLTPQRWKSDCGIQSLRAPILRVPPSRRGKHRHQGFAIGYMWLRHSLEKPTLAGRRKPGQSAPQLDEVSLDEFDPWLCTLEGSMAGWETFSRACPE